jgi:hypothetical protein
MSNEGASVKLVDKLGMERTDGEVKFDDVVLVTSADGATEKAYHLSFIGEKEGTEAYVVSEALLVDQLDNIISGIEDNTSLTYFTALLTPAPLATIRVLDPEGNEVTEGSLSGEGYTLEVTSGDGTKVVSYSLEISVGVDKFLDATFSLYPNPVNDNLYIEGLKDKGSVYVRSITGSLLKVINSRGSRLVVPMGDLPSGIYFISVQTEKTMFKPIKVIKQ